MSQEESWNRELDQKHSAPAQQVNNKLKNKQPNTKTISRWVTGKAVVKNFD